MLSLQLGPHSGKLQCKRKTLHFNLLPFFKAEYLKLNAVNRLQKFHEHAVLKFNSFAAMPITCEKHSSFCPPEPSACVFYKHLTSHFFTVSWTLEQLSVKPWSDLDEWPL